MHWLRDVQHLKSVPLIVFPSFPMFFSPTRGRRTTVDEAADGSGGIALRREKGQEGLEDEKELLGKKGSGKVEDIKDKGRFQTSEMRVRLEGEGGGCYYPLVAPRYPGSC